MSSWQLSRRGLLKAGAASAAGALIGMPALVRADPKEVVIGGPAGAAKYFNADVFPVVEKQLGVKIIYEGTNSLTNLHKMTADKDAPKMSVVIMDDPVMLVAAIAMVVAWLFHYQLSTLRLKEDTLRKTADEATTTAQRVQKELEAEIDEA